MATAKPAATITRRNRQTGTAVTVTKQADKWITVCEDHKTTAAHKSRSARDLAARTPADWCGDCAKAHKAAQRAAAREAKSDRAAA